MPTPSRTPAPIKSVTFALATFLICGCGHTPIIQSKLHCAAEVGEGIVYSLPHQLAQIKFSREQLDKDKTLAAHHKQLGVVNAMAQRIELEKSAEDNLSAQLKQFKGDDEAKRQLQQEIDRAKARTAAAQVEHNKAELELKRLRQALDASNAPGAQAVFRDTFSIQLQPITADPRWRFVATHSRSNVRHDKVVIKTTASGLLEGGSGVSDGKVDEIIIEGIGLAGALTESPTISSLLRSIEPEVGKTLVPFVEQWIVDPTIESELTKIENDLRNREAYYKLELLPLSDAAGPANPSAAFHFERPGLYYRRPVAQTLVIYGSKGEFIDSFRLNIPNGGPIGLVEFPESKWIKTEFQFRFENGMLVEYDTNIPSAAETVAGLPVKALKAVVSVPAELVQLKVNLTTKDKELLAAQKAYIDSQIELIKAQEKLKSTVDSNARPQVADQEAAP